MNPLQIAIASCSNLEDWPCLSMSRRVTWASDLGCSIGIRVTRVTHVAQSKSAYGVTITMIYIDIKQQSQGCHYGCFTNILMSIKTWFCPKKRILLFNNDLVYWCKGINCLKKKLFLHSKAIFLRSNVCVHTMETNWVNFFYWGTKIYHWNHVESQNLCVLSTLCILFACHMKWCKTMQSIKICQER